MPSVTHDGRSFMIDGRRVWLVSGRVPYARLPRDQWAERIFQAKQAGLNTIETPVFWNRHEPRPGKFDFTGDNDLRHFVDLIGKAGMYCILGLGPFIDSAWDFGGLPAWLREKDGVALRTVGGPFLEATSRFITAVADQIRGWQVTSPGTGGPILLLQCESEWTCGHEELATQYLGELTRYIREAGLSVPIINSNNLWQGVEGQIDGWAGNTNLLATMRQLAAVRPTQPRMVIDLALARPNAWGRPADPPLDPATVQRKLAEVLAGGGQFNLTTFCGGTNFGFSGGRLADGPGAFVTASADHGALIDAAGRPTAAYGMVRRLAMAASRFGRVFSNLDPSYQPITVQPGDAGGEPVKKGRSELAQPPAVLHAYGPQGGVAFVFADANGADKRPVGLLMPDGSSIQVPFGEQTVAWCFFNVNVSARGRLDYSNLCALGTVGQVLVCFGPPGSVAMLSINGSPMEAVVPSDLSAAVVEHEGVTVVLVNERGADTTFFTEDAVYVGVESVAADGSATPLAGAKAVRIAADGTSKPLAAAHSGRSRSNHDKPSIGPWSVAHMDEYVDGTSARYAKINGPEDLTRLGSPSGYGWYRVSFKGDGARKAHLALPFAGDRLHLFLDGKPQSVAGVGPGATLEPTLQLRKGPQQLVVLAENLGRFSGGANLGEGKGLYGDVLEVSAIKLGKPKLVGGAPLDVLGFRAPLWEMSEGDATSPQRLTWTLAHRRKSPILVQIPSPPSSGLLVLNDKPIAYLDRSGPQQVYIPEDQLARGNNTVQIALVGNPDIEEEIEELSSTVRFFVVEGSITADAEMSYAKWEQPAATMFAPAKGNAKSHAPIWWRTTVSVARADQPLFLELPGMTKGQVYVNGRHLCRYFVATADGKAVPGQDRYVVPPSWLKVGEPNDLVLFDEHGGNAAKVRLTADRA
jgi:hypothetical protein